MTTMQWIEAIFAEKRAFFVRVIARRLRNADIAEEIVQEAFLQVASAAEMQAIDNPEGYIMRTAINLSTDWLRQESSRRRREKRWADVSYALGADGEAASDAPSPAQATIAKDEFRRLSEAVNRLTPQVRAAFTLHKLEGLSHQETASRMGISRSTVEKHIIRAMRLLMDEMSAAGDIEAKAAPIRQVVERSADR